MELNQGGTDVRPESGAAFSALVLAGRRLGIALSAEQIRREYGKADAEPTLADLAFIAGKEGLIAKPMRLGWKALTGIQENTSVLIALRDGTILSVERFVKDGATPTVLVRNPADANAQPIALDQVRLASAWDGAALLIKRGKQAEEETDTFGFLWMIRQVMHEGKIFRDIVVAALALSLLALVPPVLYLVVIDRVLVHHRVSTLFVLAIAVAVVLVFDTLIGYLRRTMTAIATAKVDARVSLQIFEKMTRLPIDFFERNSTGVIAHKLGEARRVRTFITGQLLGAVLDTTSLLILIPAMFFLNAALTMYVLTIAVLMAIVIMVYMGPIKRAYAAVITSEHRKTALLIETVHGMRTVKSLALEGRKRREWDSRVAESVAAQTDLLTLANQPQTLLAPLEKLIYSGSLLMGAYLAVTEQQTILSGTLVAFTMVATRATSPIVQLAHMMQQFEEARGAIREVASVVNAAPEPRRENGVRPEFHGRVQFDDVRFCYPGASTPALNGVSFTVDSGTVVGVMGRSGSGKTTVTRLLQGLHAQYEGLIKIDGVDLREIDLYHLRSNMGVVLQDSFLFRGTIRENIVVGKADATPEEMVRAARMAGAEEFIERLPRGYETMIEEHAANLSGGQKQRLAIARALISDPPILVFDEATSALDPESEAIINENLRRIAIGRTVIVISHRLASLVDCDQILVLDKGRLKDHGRHAELLTRCDDYRHLWMQQNRHLSNGASHDRPGFNAVANG
ncbi:peptidase domain-containing ABC transporter [Oryzibacter oryziterrae]|uniref:peptidase domain-containing ABC transporter n=1 Tax=Oryzibacter oryziterrae TaxID=2766474 RepID=UPI001F2D827C|nr:peptidase domain-containing ABC transporter [Oryzibacter oryziterrae]